MLSTMGGYVGMGSKCPQNLPPDMQMILNWNQLKPKKLRKRFLFPLSLKSFSWKTCFRKGTLGHNPLQHQSGSLQASGLDTPGPLVSEWPSRAPPALCVRCPSATCESPTPRAPLPPFLLVWNVTYPQRCLTVFGIFTHVDFLLVICPFIWLSAQLELRRWEEKSYFF